METIKQVNWTFKDNSPKNFEIQVNNETIIIIPIPLMSEQEAKATAKLIFAAPNLLEQAILANKYLAYLASEGKINDQNEADNWSEVQQGLFNAIKKATK